jgi:hypothetical protein
VKLFASIAALVIACAGGCSRDVRLAGRAVPHVQVRAVSHYGLTLDSRASPEQVGFVLLRAIREDVEAKTAAEREKALAVQFDLAAANVIQARNKTKMARDEFIYNVVYRWAPTVSHYVAQFDLEWEKMQPRLVRLDRAADQGAAPGECEVLMQLDDPGGDANAGAVLVVWLVQDSGLWRVTHLGFKPGMRKLQAASAPRAEGTRRE